MTEAPDWALAVPAVGVHNPPPRVPGPDLLQITWQQMQQVISGLVNEFLRQVAVALGAIEIFGFHPYQALVEIGESIAAAKANFDALLSGLSVPDIGGVLGYFGNLGVTGLYNAAAGFGNLSTSLLKNLTPTGGNIGQFDASALAGALNTALTFGGTALSTLLQYLNSAGQFAASALTGGMNGSVTLGGVTLSTLVTNINSSGQLLASGITGALGTGLTVGGVTLGTLFTNINSAGQILGSGITGAINTAATLGGTQLGTLATNWNAAVTDVSAIITNAGETLAANAGAAILAANEAAADIGQAVEDAAAGAAAAVGAIGTQVYTGFAGLINGIFGGLMGMSPPAGVSQAQAGVALAGVTTNVVGNATAIMAIQEQDAARAGLVSAKFNFADYPDGALPADFSLTVDNYAGASSPGSIVIQDGRAVFSPGGSGYASLAVARYTTAMTTDYQEISWTSTGDPVFARHAYLRANSAFTTFLRVTIGTSAIDFRTVLAGVQTAITSYSYTFKPGARYTLKAGDLLDKYTIYLFENDRLVRSFTDSLNLHQVGASYRYGAIGILGLNDGSVQDYGVDSVLIADQLFQPGPPAAAYVSTSQTTTSTTYADLATTTDTVTVNVGSSGMVAVFIYSNMQNTGNAGIWTSFAISGATTLAASDSYAVEYSTPGAGWEARIGSPFIVPNLNPGSTTFKMKYRVNAGTGSWKDRRISAIPL
ncbi:DUF7257 domain-containing protein [Mycobacterium sp. ML4]